MKSNIVNLLYDKSDYVKELFSLARLWLPVLPASAHRSEVPLIASMTSYPPRIKMAWIAIESLLRQTVRPKKLILVLSREEFPDGKIPRRIQRQTGRGLEIMWIDRTAGSYDKLIPVRQAYPTEAIATFDDDKIFPHTLLERLYESSRVNPKSVIGSRGWRIRQANGHIHYGLNWVRAEPGAKGRDLITPGGNGCLYPPLSLDPIVDNVELARELCPTADDIWFWFATQKARSSIVCLGMGPHRNVRLQGRTPALAERNAVQNDVQFQQMVETFGLPPESRNWLS